ncbi:cupin domain-containing protein [Pseudarthrobacter sp. SSS035]|uniref:cupin domain-containing protein n=1 Tax=Pseudarthrobacter sp. SSS035 TaxID=2931399 RepID=UPI00200F877C|nr:cupin domain-containing protein [Pseudarthrobacter sp. SSS035]
MTAGPLVQNIEDLGFVELDQMTPSGIRDEGLICQLISDKVNGSKEFTVSWGRMLSGQHHVKHHHETVAEFYVIVAGTPIIHLGDDDIRARPGDAFYIPPTTVHGITNDTDEVVDLVAGVNSVGQWDFIADE